MAGDDARSKRELPADRLATADERGHRIWLYPADVRGRYRNRRGWIHAALMLFFLVLPWVRIDGNQWVFLDIERRRFTLFGMQFWAQDTPMLLLVLAGFAITLAWVTLVFGRVWCGWACPQTVFIESVYRRIERWTEGDGVSRRRLDAAPWSGRKILLKSTKWFLFFGVSMVLAHSFLAYFVGTERLAAMVTSSPLENPGSFIFMMSVVGLTLFDFGWFREQFCTIVCPYGRLQSVLMDDRSQVIAYDQGRGEPRKGLVANGVTGDCVNCFRCVQVCPTGVDIRRGLQLECIACSACADACDEVMTRLKKAPGLVRYQSLVFSRPKVWVYGALVVAIWGGLAVAIERHEMYSFTVIRAVGAPYQAAGSGESGPEWVNRFKLDLDNRSFDPVGVRVAVEDGRVKLAGQQSEFDLAAGESKRAEFFVKFPGTLLVQGKARVSVEVRFWSGKSGERVVRQEVTLVGP